MSPVVTVGLPFHNEARFLATAVRSILAQTFADFRLVLLDDGSTDDSLAIARGFRDPRLEVISDGRRRHLPARLNEILRAATTPLVARMDGDDIAHPERLRRQLAVMEAQPRCDAVGTLAVMIEPDGTPLGVVGELERPLTRRRALGEGLLVHPTMVARREFLLANPYDETITRAEDRDLWCRTAESAHFEVVPQPLLLKRVDPTGMKFLPGYLESHRQNRILFLRHGPAVAGPIGTARLWLASMAKSIVMRVATRARLDRMLVRRRGRPLRQEERVMVREALDAAREPQRA